jgi:hypothetical protein
LQSRQQTGFVFGLSFVDVVVYVFVAILLLRFEILLCGKTAYSPEPAEITMIAKN